MSESQQSSPENDNKKKNKKNPRRRQVHNEVERRRKDKINGWIMKISELLPNSELQKSSKISILEQTVSYIKELVSERSKMLSENCSDVQENEVKNLKKKVMFLEAQNSLYVKLLQQAKISLTSLPKKTPKYSNKCTAESSEILMKKLKSDSFLNRPLSSNNSVLTENRSDSSDSTSSMHSTSSATVNTSTPCVTVSTNVTAPSVVQIQSKIKIPRVTPSTTSQNTTSVASQETGGASVVAGPTCMLEARTTFGAGGVTSALSPFPVMSSTLGSSFGNVYSRSIPTVIILPTGGGFVHPSLLSSNISVISSAVENVLPIIVPQQSHNVPSTTSVVNVLGPNGINQIVNGMSNSLPTILSLPTSSNESAISRSLPSSSVENHVCASSNVETVSDVPLTEKAHTFLHSTSNAKDAAIYPKACENEKNQSSSGTTTISDYAIFVTSSMTSFSTPALNKVITSEVNKPQCESTKINLQKHVNDVNSLDIVPNSSAKKCIRNTPLSLQAISANKIISLANKLQGQTNPSLSSKVSVDCNSMDSIPLKNNMLPLENISISTNSAISTSSNLLPVTVSPMLLSTSLETNQELCQSTSKSLSSQEINADSNASKIQKVNIPSVEPFTHEDNSTKLSSIVSTKLSSVVNSPVQSDPKIISRLSPVTGQQYYFTQAEKSTELINKFSPRTSESSLSSATDTSCAMPELSSSSISNASQVLSWSNNLLELETNNTITTKNSSEQFDVPSVEEKIAEIEQNELLDQSIENPINVNVSQSKNTEKTVVNVQHVNTSKSPWTISSDLPSLQKKTFNAPDNENPVCDTSSKASIAKEQLNDEAIKYITSIAMSNLNPTISSTAPSKCHDSATPSTTVNTSASQLYSDVSYVNNILPQPLEAISHPPVAWVRPTSHMFNQPDTSPVKEKEHNTYSFQPSDYQNSITLHPVEAPSCSPAFTFEKLKDKTTKTRSKSVKKSKSLPGLSSNSFTIMPEVVTNIENFSVTAGDVFPSTQTLISDQRSNEHSNLVRKSDNLNSTSDILAKAAESIFGHDAFHSIEIASEEPSSQGSIIPYDVTTSYSNSDVFTQVFTSSDTSKITNCGSYSSSKFGDNRFQDADSGKSKTLTSNKVNSSSSISNVAYSTNSEVFSRVRKANSNPENEPQAKKPRENPSTSSSLSICPVVSSTIYTQRNTTKFQGNFSKQQKQQTIGNSNTPNSELDNISRNGNSKGTSECLQTQQTTFYALAKKPNCSGNQIENLPLQTIPHTISNAVSLDLPRFHQSAVSEAPCVHITHPVNNLFINSTNINTKNNNKVSVAQNKMDSRRNYHDYPGGNVIAKQDFLPGKELNALKSTRSTSSDNIVSSNPLAENSLSHFLNHSNAMVFPTTQTSNNQASSLSNHLDLFNPHSATLPHTKSQVSNTPQLVELPTQLSHSMIQDSTSRVQAPFNSNLQNYRSSSDIHAKTCVQSSVHATSLSHSLCSLLKETSSNSISRDLSGNNSFPMPSTSLPVTVSSGVSKYSALSLISNQPCLATKQTTVSKSGNTLSTINVSSTTQPVVSLCSKSSKSSLSYSAERLIQNQYPLNDKDKGKTASSNLMPNRTLNSDLYKPSNYIPTVSSEINMQSLPRMPLPPATSYPTFPPSFSMCDVRPTTEIHTSSQYQDISQNATKDIFSQTTNFSVSSQVQNNSCTNQNMSGSTSLPKSHPNLSLNFENSGTMYNSCNFLQPPIPSMDSGKSSDSGACFPPIFVNSNYTSQPSKKNYCHFVNQIPPQVVDTTVEKNFSIMPPITPFSDKSVVHDHRQTHDSGIVQNTSGYVSNIFYEPTSCSHESIGGSKPSIQRTSQEMYVPHRSKQSSSIQPPCVPSLLKTQSQNKGKARKSKHIAASGDLNRTNVFNPSNCMNFNVFTVPDLSCGKSNLHHVPNNYKNSAQPVIPSIGDIPAQQGKLPETILSSVISPHHAPFNTGLHQQNDLLSLNFQAPNYASTPLTMHPPLTLSSCTPAPKTTRSFSSVPNPVPNFNLSNILPDMGCSNTDINFPPIKFPPECQPNSSSSSAVLSAPHQPCTSSLYTPHPSVVPNALPPLLNHAPHSLNRNRPPLPTSGSIPQPPHFSSPQTQPFQNIIHSLNFSRPDRQN